MHITSGNGSSGSSRWHERLYRSQQLQLLQHEREREAERERIAAATSSTISQSSARSGEQRGSDQTLQELVSMHRKNLHVAELGEVDGKTAKAAALALQSADISNGGVLSVF